MKCLVAAVLAAAFMAPAAQAVTTIVDVSGTANASLDGSNAVSVALGAGTYTLNFVSGAYQAFTRFDNVSGCDGGGANCTTGYENSVRYFLNGATPGTGFGDGSANGGLGPIDPGNAYYQTAALSLANSGGYQATFNLAAPGTIGFYLVDDNVGDNSGGVSLAITSVPEPATWAMMIAGVGLVGGTMRVRRRTGGLALA